MSILHPEIPEPLQDVFEGLWQEVAGLHVRWKMFRQLYGTNEQRIQLLNEIAGNFFGCLQGILLDDVVLGLSKLTDRPRMAGRENLVLGQLIEKLDGLGHEDLVTTLRQKLISVEEACRPLRLKRNRRVAHLDLEVALSSDTNLVPGISRAMIEAALKEAREYMNLVQGHFTGGNSTAYDYVSTKRDADWLIFALRKAAEYDLAVTEGLIPRNRLREGKYKDV